MKDKWNVKNKECLKIHICSRRCKKQQEDYFDDEGYWRAYSYDSKALPELIEQNILKSNDDISSIDKLLFADDGASMMVMIFLDVWQQTMNLVALY